MNFVPASHAQTTTAHWDTPPTQLCAKLPVAPQINAA